MGAAYEIVLPYSLCRSCERLVPPPLRACVLGSDRYVTDNSIVCDYLRLHVS